MATFPWVVEQTRHFDDQPFPIVPVQVRSLANQWRVLPMLLDTGAVISVLPRSVGEALGVTVEAGNRISLVGVGERYNEMYVHEFSTRFQGLSTTRMRIAISPHENVPKLLGRLDVMDRYRICLNPVVRETRIEIGAQTTQ